MWKSYGDGDGVWVVIMVVYLGCLGIYKKSRFSAAILCTRDMDYIVLSIFSLPLSCMLSDGNLRSEAERIGVDAG